MHKRAFFTVAVASAVFAILAVVFMSVAVYASDGDYEKGVAYLRAGRAEEALKFLEPLLTNDPSDPYLFYHIGLARYKLGMLDAASDAFARAGELAGKGVRDELNLGAAFGNLGIGYYRKKDFNGAERSLEHALSLDPGDGDSRYYLGLVRMEQGSLDKALEELDRARSLKKDDKKALAAISNAAGIAYYRQEKTDQALNKFAGTLTLEPDNVEALYYAGLISYKEGGYGAAKPYFDKIASAGVNGEKAKEALFTTFFNMGIDFQNRDKSASAAEMFGKALTIKPDDPDAHFYRGYNLAALERYEEAADEFGAALKLRPDMPRARAQLDVAGKFASEAAQKEAGAMMDRGEYYAALQRFEKARALDPASAGPKKGAKDAAAALEKETNERVAGIKGLIGTGEYVKAREGITGLKKANPGFAGTPVLSAGLEEKLATAVRVYSMRAKDAEERDALGEASGWYGKLIAADPGNMKAAQARRMVDSKISDEWKKARAALGEGNLLAAKKNYERLATYVPNDPEVKKGLGDVRDRIDAEVSKCIEKSREALAADELDTAVALCNRALALAPGNQAAASTQKKIAARSREIERARAADAAREAEKARESEKAQYTPVSAEAADDVRRLYLAGVEHYTKGELKEAIDNWREVLKLDPRNEKAISSISKAEEKLKEASEGPGK